VSALVIVGASLAGFRAAQAARASGWDGDVVLVGEERHMPYTRPPLSKELLASPAQAAVPYLRPAELEATWLLEQRATELDRAARRVGLAGGEQIPY
jgi:NADPH-dependent 2,4-dienoyl-CoA reductase/sulfur reductase-like enzyme